MKPVKKFYVDIYSHFKHNGKIRAFATQSKITFGKMFDGIERFDPLRSKLDNYEIVKKLFNNSGYRLFTLIFQKKQNNLKFCNGTKIQ